jgi:hypothetical protein
VNVSLRVNTRRLSAALARIARRVRAWVKRMNLHQRGQCLLNRGTGSQRATGVAVLYCRGESAAPLVATPSVEAIDATLEPTTHTRSDDRERDYLIVFADLADAGYGVPQEGDRITETLAGEPVVFEVVPRERQPAWRWADAQRTRVRVHTRRAS